MIVFSNPFVIAFRTSLNFFKKAISATFPHEVATEERDQKKEEIKELKKAVEEKDRELEVAKEEKHQLVLRCWLNSFLYGGCGNQCRIVRSVFLTFEKSRMAREA